MGWSSCPTRSPTSLLVLDAETGVPLRVQPLEMVPAGGVAISGNSVYMGSGISENIPGIEAPLSNIGGVWAFSTTP